MAEFSHDERSDALAAKEATKKANQWKKSGGQRLGSGAAAGGIHGRTVRSGVMLGGRQLGRGTAPGRLAWGHARDAAAAAATRRAERLGGQTDEATTATTAGRTAKQPRGEVAMTNKKRLRSASLAKTLLSTSGRGAASSGAARQDTGQRSVANAFSAQLRHQKKLGSTLSAPSVGAAEAGATEEEEVWSCSVCTLRNSSGVPQCAACGVGRLTDAARAPTNGCTGEAPTVIDLCDDGPE